MKHNQTYHIAIYGLGIAIVFISTMFIQIPIPLGYANLGNCFVFLFAMFLDEKAGFIIGGVGSALADLLGGWSMWAIPTFFLKGLMGYLVGKIGKMEVTSLRSPYLLLASLTGTLEGIIGYTLVGATIYHSLPTGLTQAPGLIVEGIVNMVAFYMIYGALNAGKVKQLFKR